MKQHKAGPTAVDILFLGILCVSAVLVISSLHRVIFADGADEGYYLRYAARASREGISSLRSLCAEYIAQRERWLFPSPLRVAFILLSALWVRIWGLSYEALAALSLCCYLATLYISYHYCRKYLDSTTALLFSLLLAFSPLNMAMARRALVDGPANMFAVLSVWLLFDAVHEGGWLRRVLFVGIYAMTILMKEVLIVLAPVFALYLAIAKYARRRRLSLRDILVMTLCPPLLALALLILAAGDGRNVFKIIRIILASPAANRYAILYCSGGWIRYIVDFMLLSPWVCILALGYFFTRMCLPDPGEGEVYFSILGAGYLLILLLFVKNIRYAMLLETPMRLFAVLMIRRIAERYTPRHARAACAVCVAAICVSDYIFFYDVFVLHKLYDPVSILLLKARQLIPAG